MQEQPNKIVRNAISNILDKLQGINLIYLFGSRVKGTVGPMSDYDLGVLIDRKKDGPQVRSELSYILADKLKTKNVDVVILNSASIELAFSIIAYGKLIYERDVVTRVEYESRVMGLYFDYLPILRAQRHDILQGGEYATRIQRYREAFGRTERTLSQIRPAKR